MKDPFWIVMSLALALLAAAVLLLLTGNIGATLAACTLGFVFALAALWVLTQQVCAALRARAMDAQAKRNRDWR